MKLHLPVILLTAVLAAMTAGTAQARYTLNSSREDDEWATWLTSYVGGGDDMVIRADDVGGNDWVASRDGTLGEGGTVEVSATDILNKDVTIDTDTTIKTATSMTADGYANRTIHNLRGTEGADLTITTGHDLTVYNTEDTVFAGNITFGASGNKYKCGINKMGKGSFTVEGDITGEGTLRMFMGGKEGKAGVVRGEMTVDGEVHIEGALWIDSKTNGEVAKMTLNGDNNTVGMLHLNKCTFELNGDLTVESNPASNGKDVEGKPVDSEYGGTARLNGDIILNGDLTIRGGTTEIGSSASFSGTGSLIFEGTGKVITSGLVEGEEAAGTSMVISEGMQVCFEEVGTKATEIWNLTSEGEIATYDVWSLGTDDPLGIRDNKLRMYGTGELSGKVYGCIEVAGDYNFTETGDFTQTVLCVEEGGKLHMAAGESCTTVKVRKGGTLYLHAGDAKTPGLSTQGMQMSKSEFAAGSNTVFIVDVTQPSVKGPFVKFGAQDSYVIDPDANFFVDCEKGMEHHESLADILTGLKFFDGYSIDTGHIYLGENLSVYYTVEAIEDLGNGTYTITLAKKNYWDAVEDGDEGNHHAFGNASDLQWFESVIIDEDTTVTADDNVTLEHLVGTGGDVEFKRAEGDEGDKNITLNYEKTENGSDATFGGSIKADEGVNLEKTGESGLTVNGGLQTKGDVSVKEGALNLGSESDSSIGGDLAVGGGDTQADMHVDGKLGVTGDVTVENGQLSFGSGSEGTFEKNLQIGDKEAGTGGDVQVDGQLGVTGDVSVEKGTLTFGQNSSGTLGGLSLAEDSKLQVDGHLGVTGDVSVEGGEAQFGDMSDSTIGGALSIGDNGTSGDVQVDGKLGVTGDVAVENGQLSFSGESEGSIGGNLKLGDKGNGTTGDVQVDKKLDVAGDVSVEKGTLTFGENSSGTLGGLSLSEDGNMQVGGQLDVTGDVKVEKGTLSFGEKSEGSIGGELSLSEGGNLQVDGQLTLSGGVAEGGKGSVRGSGTVTLDGEDSAFGNDVELDEHLTFKMGEHAKRADFGQNDVTLRDLSGDKDVTAHSVDMTGEGDFSGTIHGDVDVNSKGAFSGTVYGDVNLNYTEPETGDPGYVGSFTGTVHGDVDVHGKYNLSGARVHGNLDVGGTDAAKGDVTLDEAQQHLTVDGDVILREGATTRIRLNFGDEAEWKGREHDAIVLETAKNIIIESGTCIEIDNLGGIAAESVRQGEKEVILMDAKHVFTWGRHYDEAKEHGQLHDTESVGAEHDAEVTLKLDGALNLLFRSVQIVFYNGHEANEQEIMLTAGEGGAETPQHDSYVAAIFERSTDADLAWLGTTPNSIAARKLLMHYYCAGMEDGSSTDSLDPMVLAVLNYLGDTKYTNAKEARRVLAAVAGSTLTSLSAAQYAEHRWQMGRVRDHALMAGNLRCAEYNPDASRMGACRTTQVWAEGTSFFSEQHARRDESGYRLNSWGGAFGLDVQMRSNWSVGLALAANYGDLEAHTVDRADGDFDSYYMSAWSQAKNGRWGNTLVATFGVSDASLKRTVNCGPASFAGKSTSSGSSLGAMWELTYDLYPDKDNHKQILQPLFSVAVSHTSMDAFSETGAGGLSLNADKQTRDTVTLGLGARWMAAIETGKVANRTISTELRMNVAQDMGDRCSSADVALQADPTYTQTVQSARAGTTAFQIGAGINVPVTRYSQLYFNAGGDLRAHAATWNGALGVRIGF